MDGRKKPLEIFAQKATEWAGSSWASLTAFAIILLWLLAGPFFNYSDSWQLFINTSTTIVTFLMVFLIQRAQNKESLTVQLKLNELIAALKGARNQVINIDEMSEEEATIMREQYRRLASKVDETCVPSNPDSPGPG